MYTVDADWSDKAVYAYSASHKANQDTIQWTSHGHRIKIIKAFLRCLLFMTVMGTSFYTYQLARGTGKRSCVHLPVLT